MLEKLKTSRRTQDERSAQMRKRLHDATIALLMDVGYANMTTAGIAKRAGVSRGAQTHHYPEKIDLIVAATDDMFHGFSSDLAHLAARLRRGELTLDQFLEKVWKQMLQGNWFYSSLEIIVAARGDEELRKRLQPLILDLHSRFEEIWSETFEPCEGSDVDPVVMVNVAMNMFRGMAVQAVLRPDKTYFNSMLDVLGELIRDNIRPKREV